MSLPGRSKRLELEFRLIEKSLGMWLSSRRVQGGAVVSIQLPQAFPDHKITPFWSPWELFGQSCGGSGGAPCQVLPSFQASMNGTQLVWHCGQVEAMEHVLHVKLKEAFCCLRPLSWVERQPVGSSSTHRPGLARAS